MSATDRATTVEARLAFARAANVGPDDERPGLLRARTLPPERQATPDSFDWHTCRARDWGESDRSRPDLLRHGFDCVDLSPLAGLQAVLHRVRDAGHLREEDAREIRTHLTGARFRLGDGSWIRVLSIAPEGFILRRAGPHGMAVSPRDAMTAMNGHDAARSVHADQDVRGTPMRQLLRGAAPWLFRHDAPDSRNRWSPLWLLNLWIPLQQITRPLALMDKRSLDRRAQQLRYGLPTDAFLDRDEDQRINDIWSFLHDARQQWYFRSELDSSRAYLFETLGTPHGSFVIPGESLAERRYRQLEAAREAIRGGDPADLHRAIQVGGDVDEPVATPALRRAVAAMDALLGEAARDANALCEGRGAEDWCTRAARAMDAVVRKSIEMRVVAVRMPRLGPRRPVPA